MNSPERKSFTTDWAPKRAPDHRCGTGDQWRKIDVELAEHQQGGDTPDRCADDAAEHETDGLGAGLGTLSGGLLDEESTRTRSRNWLSALLSDGLAIARVKRITVRCNSRDEPGRQQDEGDADRPVEDPLGSNRPELAVGPFEDPLTGERGFETARIGQRIGRFLAQHACHGRDGTPQRRASGGSAALLHMQPFR